MAHNISVEEFLTMLNKKNNKIQTLMILLKNTIETLEDQCDFNSAEHFIDFLIEETGISPEEYNELYAGEQYLDETGALKKVVE